MAKKDLETLKAETWELRYRLHVAVEINKVTLQEALKEVLPDSKTRKRTFETWKAKGLWPISEDEKRFIGTIPDQNIPAAPVDVTQQEPTATLPEVSAVPDQAGSRIAFGFTQTEPPVTQTQKAVEEEFPYFRPRAEGVRQEFLTETQPEEWAVGEFILQPEDEPTSEVVTQAVSSDTQATEQPTDISVTLGFTAFDRKEVEEMIREMVQTEVQKVIASIPPGLQQQEKPDLGIRPVFKREETVTRSIRISKMMAEQAEAKAKADRIRTGGNLNALIEVLLWDYLDRPNDLIEDES